ncbi:transposase IS150 [Bordetella holmesii F627]|nr:integrase [Bordetella holmesii H558]AMD47440.1 transposase IS150 [Bordetella holmesii F627]AOB36095.1 integrase [Bordetella holmesii]SUV95463.1 transposase [Bordetella holmesii]
MPEQSSLLPVGMILHGKAGTAVSRSATVLSLGEASAADVLSFFGTRKAEFFHLNRFESIEQLQAGIRQYIRYYNHDRIKLKLKGLSPVQYRTQAFGL